MRKLSSAFLYTVLLLAAAPLFAAYPKPQGRINDFAHVLSAKDKDRLQMMVNEVETQTSAELFVVTVTSLDGKTIEVYANQLFNQWGIGKKGKDNGLLVLICPEERKMRVEVGYGLESTITDGLAGEVIRKDFTPYFKNGNYPTGIQQGIERLAHYIEDSDSAKEWIKKDRQTSDFWLHVQAIGFLSVFVIIGGSFLGLGLGSKTGFWLLMGTLFAGIPLIGVFFTHQFIQIDQIILSLITLIFFILGFLLGRKFPKAFKKVKKGRPGSGWSWGASHGSGSGSSGGGGGGGGSGGGGASGGW